MSIECGIKFAQRYKIEVDWDAYGTSVLKIQSKKDNHSNKKGNPYQQSVALLGTPVADKWAHDERKHFVTNNTVTIPPYHISIVLLKPLDP